jgi:hypothetical protein
VKSAAQTLRANPGLNVEAAITELGVGEALVSFLDEKGRPNVVERASVLPPASRIGPLTADERQAIIKGSAIYGHYEAIVDRDSAYEKLKGRSANNSPAKANGEQGSASAQEPASGGGWLDGLGDIFGGPSGVGKTRSASGDSILGAAAKSAARAIGSQVGREIIRGVLGSLLGGSSRRR